MTVSNKSKRISATFTVFFFFSRCYEFLKKIHSDFQCCAQISFSRFRDQCHIVLNHFLKLPKKRSCFLFFLFATLQYLCFKFKGTALRACVCVCAWWVFILFREQNKLFCINLQFRTIRSISFAVWLRLLLRPLRDSTSCLSCLPNMSPHHHCLTV